MGKAPKWSPEEEDSEYKKNKQKTMEGILKVQGEQRRDFCTYMNNQATASAFKMMKDMYNAYKDTNPRQAAIYLDRMRQILDANTAGDTTGETVKMDTATEDNNSSSTD